VLHCALHVIRLLEALPLSSLSLGLVGPVEL